MTGKQRLIAAAVAAAVLLAWALIAFWIGPAEIARAHRGESLPFLNDVVSARASIPLEEYLADWRRLCAWLGLRLLAAGVLIYGAAEFLSTGKGRRARAALAERVRQSRERGPIWSAATILVFAVWLGLFTGLLEAVHTVIRDRHLPGVTVSFFAHGWADVWMAPLVNAVVLGVFSLVLLLPRLVKRSPPLDRPIALLLAVAAIYALGRVLLKGVHPAAVVLLAFGVSWQLVRACAARPESWRRIVRRSTLILAVGIAVWSAGAHTILSLAESRRVAALPASDAGHPNILLIVLDTVRARSLGLYGHARATSPALDTLAANGVVFANAMSPSSWTLPSHASMFTGRWAHELSTDWESPLDDTYPTLAEWLSDRGYLTAGFAANIGYCGPAFGLQRGFNHYDARPNSPTYVFASSNLGRSILRYVYRRLMRSHQDLVRVKGSEIREEFADWLDGEDGRPWFAFLNLYDAHAPYLPPSPWDERFSRPDARYWFKPAGSSYSEQSKQDLVDTYDNSVAYADHELGLILADLARSGQLGNTIVVITSDHGEEFDEHGVWQHGQTLYLPSLHVPLVVVWPGGVPEGRTVDAYVSLRDIPATLTHLVSGEADPAFPGSSLARHWTTPGSPGTGATSQVEPLLAALSMRDYLPGSSPAGRGDLASILTDGLHYIRVDDGGEELFDVVEDPWEQTDLGTTEEGQSEMRRLARELADATRVDP